MLGDIKSAVKDNMLAQEYLGNLERLLHLAPYVKDVMSNTKFYIHDGVQLALFLDTLNWLIDAQDS